MGVEDTPSAVQPPVEPAGALTQDERTWGMFCHLSALLGLFVAGFTFIGPLICWLVKKDMSKFVDHNGKESLNFHLNILGYYVISIVVAIATCGIGIPLVLAVHVYGIVMTILAGAKASGGEWYRYPAILRLI